MARDGVYEVLMKGRPRQRGRGPRPPEMLRTRGKPPKVTSHHQCRQSQQQLRVKAAASRGK